MLCGWKPVPLAGLGKPGQLALSWSALFTETPESAMKKLLVLVLLSATALAHAQTWEAYAQSPDTTRYFDKFRRVVMSGMAFVWDMHDLGREAVEEGKAYRSVLYPTEYNCRTVQKRVLSSHKMSEPMGSGATVAESTIVGPWTDVLPGSADDRLMVAACSP